MSKLNSLNQNKNTKKQCGLYLKRKKNRKISQIWTNYEKKNKLTHDVKICKIFHSLIVNYIIWVH